ncbi:MAG: hypothetical protein NC131_11095 [Roseburia sp.]|nr:hypothetical protein [Roseburia sp.]
MSTSGIGYDAAFGLNEFGQAKLCSEIEVVRNAVLTAMFGRKGQYPSLPMIGMDIGSRLYSFYNEIDCEELKQELIQQCSALGVYVQSNVVQMKKDLYRNQPSLLIQISGQESYPSSYMRDTVSPNRGYRIGITYDDLNQMIYSVNTV